MSVEQKRYLKKIKLKKVFVLFIQMFLIIAFILLWEILSKKEIINPFIYSSPSRIIKMIVELLKANNLFNHIICTLKEIIISFLLGTFLGFIIAVLLYEFKMLAKVLEPFLITLNSLPKVALGPMIIIIAGANLKSIIIMTLLINLIVTILNLYNGFKMVDYNKLLLMRMFNANKWQILKCLIFPGSLDTIISTIKINISMTLIGVIMGEFLVSKEGIGYLIIYGTQIFNMNLVMSGILLLIIISVGIYLLVSMLLNHYQK